ncbi:hypothetical protein [Streptomyces sp. NPDC002205]|uniref:hypothetical protein n=1 Tax=Streptomyces sp. NPDC002205 TaxID=3154411 RepID=UPI0033329BC6
MTGAPPNTSLRHITARWVGSWSSAQVTGDDSTVYVLTADDTLRAVDRKSRRIRWTERASCALSVGTSGRATAGSGHPAVSTSDGDRRVAAGVPTPGAITYG